MTTIAPARETDRRLRETLVGCLLLAALTLVGLAAALAPTANAGPDRKLESSLRIDGLNIYDPALTAACGFEVVGLISGDEQRKVELGDGKHVAARETSTFKGTITWIARESGKTYTGKIDSTSKIDYPEGIDLFLPAHVTVTGTNGGTFPVGDGPPGHGRFEYDALIYATSDGFPYLFAVSEPTWTGKNFDKATGKVCAALG